MRQNVPELITFCGVLIHRNTPKIAEAMLFSVGQLGRKAMKHLRMAKIAIATTTFACTALLTVGWSEQRGVSLSVESAQARIGRPLTPLSVAGVARRNYRRAAYGYGAGVVGAGVAAAAIGTAAAASYYGNGYYDNGYYSGTGWGYGGYGTGYYGAYGGYPGYYGGVYANRSYITGRPTLIPRYYGGYGAGSYYGSYARGYPSYYGGVYANRSYITGRPTLIPRYYGGGWGAWTGY
jgi:hypothetical protein